MSGRRWRPLDRVPSIKLKLGVLLVAAVAVTSLVIAIGHENGWPIPVLALGGIAVGLVMVHLLARGMTFPLREMAEAATAMARGDHDRRVTATSRDEVGDLARAFNRMSAELAEVDRMRRDLVANVSHELRTPIGALRAVLENLVDGVEDADPETFRTMLAQVDRLGRLIDQLLDLSRLESGAVPIERRTFDVGTVIDEAVREAGLHATVSLEVDAGPGLRAHGDPERIHQVVANLVQNAIDHSPDGGIVRIDGDRADGRVRITVTDQGPGVPPEEAGRIFERFYRADVARTGDGGTGLGLSIVRWIIDLHDGDVRVEDADPHGCRMVVELPEGRS